MTTIIINENTEDGRHLMGVIRAMRKTTDAVVRIFDEEEMTPDSLTFEHIPGIPCTREELIEAVQLSRDDIAAGRIVPHEELKKRMSTWK